MGIGGVGIGMSITLNNLITIKYLGIDKLPAAFGASSVLLGVSFLLFGPLIGKQIYVCKLLKQYNVY